TTLSSRSVMPVVLGSFIALIPPVAKRSGMAPISGRHTAKLYLTACRSRQLKPCFRLQFRGQRLQCADTLSCSCCPAFASCNKIGPRLLHLPGAAVLQVGEQRSRLPKILARFLEICARALCVDQQLVQGVACRMRDIDDRRALGAEHCSLSHRFETVLNELKRLQRNAQSWMLERPLLPPMQGGEEIQPKLRVLWIQIRCTGFAPEVTDRQQTHLQRFNRTARIDLYRSRQ